MAPTGRCEVCARAGSGAAYLFEALCIEEEETVTALTEHLPVSREAVLLHLAVSRRAVSFAVHRAQVRGIWSTFAAQTKSFSERPRIAWVVKVTWQ